MIFEHSQQPLLTLPDGTVKQINPLSGTEVWTVPGRGHRPIAGAASAPGPIDHSHDGAHCAFCSLRYLETPPEKARLIRTSAGWERRDFLPARDLGATTAEFRRVPNLFEILSLNYWRANYGFRMPAHAAQRMESYLADPAGHAHAMSVARTKALAAGLTPSQWDRLPDDARRQYVEGFFAGGHDVIIARRHFADGATSGDHLASSGTLTPEEHFQYVSFTVDAMRDLYSLDPHVLYVAVFQNWLRPAGASFDHLHKQLVAIDEYGAQAQREHRTVARNPNIYNDLAVGFAAEYGLLLAENDYAVAFAGFGHRYPTIEVYSKSRMRAPWKHTPAEVRGMSDVLHAAHAATGPTVAANEEWYHKPKGFDVQMPWRILLKWRISTLAGFEGSTKINVNTISPFALRERVLARLVELRSQGLIAPMKLGDECNPGCDCLQYNAPGA